MNSSRRSFLLGLAALAAAGCASRLVSSAPAGRDPFTLGVASGYPRPDGFVLWTRLAPEPLAPDGGMPPAPVRVIWEVAADEAFARVVRRGETVAVPALAHAVHIEVRGLEPDRWYSYRFRTGEAVSPPGRTRTAPAPDAPFPRLAFALASCQHYEHGYYAAYRHMVAEPLDLVVHVGDYIYEYSLAANTVRSHGAGEAVTLEDYRRRYALYRLDPALQAAHAAFPWIVTWDDHEVDNDYANDRSQDLEEREAFLARRAAAYQAYYEHMPLPAGARPSGPAMRLYTQAAFGRLARFFVLDGRQYRDPQPCPRPGRGGGATVQECPERLEPGRSMLGKAQERWLTEGFERTRAQWNVIAQQTMMASMDRRPGDGQAFWTDSWDGYPAARRRLLEALVARRVSNPVVLSGDLHAFGVSDLKLDFDDPRSPPVASEFVTTSISSRGFSQRRIEEILSDNPHLKLADGRFRGYTTIELEPQRAVARLRALRDATNPESAIRTLAEFVVESGRPGPQRRA
ncbi:alkaline phosphatase D family protein [Pelomicrobium methylotrophicum]|uniref:Alkaline phosphatase n=1 Tax=Pelomicrobium methylotrophicum TaxID=2602750 RepID=A0A5C7ETM8_9PROT|nr:alkaline phosphatase D family protein [Pelomicrobium methylotrophicum]TXF11324.1 alkaline phosphatase [Pelomicrobium methylotrophicum]